MIQWHEKSFKSRKKKWEKWNEESEAVRLQPEDRMLERGGCSQQNVWEADSFHRKDGN